MAEPVRKAGVALAAAIPYIRLGLIATEIVATAEALADNIVVPTIAY